MASAVLLLLLVVFLLTSPPLAAAVLSPGPALPPLADRLAPLFFPQTAAAGAGEEGGGYWVAECWGAVAELRACTEEAVLFFLSGGSYLGTPCCLAIRAATRHCWPAVLAAAGFTARQADFLRGFCHAETPPPAPAATPPPSLPAPAAAAAPDATAAQLASR